MELNRIISLVIGFIVLILIFVWIAGRFRATTLTTSNAPTATVTMSPTPTMVGAPEEDRTWKPFAFLFNNDEPTATPTKPASNLIPTGMIISPTTQQNTQQAAQPTMGTITYTNNQTNQTTATTIAPTQQIPATGVSTAFLPTLISVCVAGMYLHRKSS